VSGEVGGTGRVRSLRSVRGAAHSEGAAADGLLDEYPGNEYRIGDGTSEVYDRRGDMLDSHRQKVGH